MVFLDEAGYYFGGHNDGLKEDLRKIDGVPNATYLVKEDGQVFVFDKLVQLVNEHRERQLDVPRADLARSLIAMDRFRLGRKFNVKPIEVEQNLADRNGGIDS